MRQRAMARTIKKYQVMRNRVERMERLVQKARDAYELEYNQLTEDEKRFVQNYIDNQESVAV